MREWRGGDAISSNAVDVVHGDASDGDDHSGNTDGHNCEEDNTDTQKVADHRDPAELPVGERQRGGMEERTRSAFI